MSKCGCGLSRKPDYPKGHFDLCICEKHIRELDDLRESLGIEKRSDSGDSE